MDWKPTAARVKLVVIVGVLVAVAAIVLRWVNPPPKTGPLAMQDVLDRMGHDVQTEWRLPADFIVQVTDRAVPIGTPLRPGFSIPIEDEHCRAAKEPKFAGAPNLPNYRIDTSAALSLGLGQFFDELGSAGLKAKAGRTADISFTDPGSQLLSDAAVDQIFSSPDCLKALRGRTVTLVRGYVIAKRRIVLEDMSYNQVEAAIPNLVSFNVEPGSGRSGVTIEDKAPAQFLQIVSNITPPMAVGQDILVTAPVVAPPAIGAPKSGLVYIQRDKADPEANGLAVAEDLRKLKLRVAPSVEAINSDKMPKKAQVRYFHVDDQALAETALAALKARYPDAIAVHTGLPSPAGQLEVWLPKHPPPQP